jgi:CheY-like chemotaxis protein
MSGGGVLSIETANVEESRPGRRAGRYVALDVRDTGCGIDAAILPHIFQPFFSTKAGKGTGLGLSSCEGIVSQSGGYIDVESAPGTGSRFRILLPRVDGVLDAARAPALAASSPQGTESLLLVEDAPAVADVVARILTRLGYRVTIAADAGAAAAAVDDEDASFDLVVCDLVVPGGTARDVVATVRRRFPYARALFVSGYSDHPAVAAAGHDGFLSKPFTSEALSRRIRLLLDGDLPSVEPEVP